MERLYQAAKTLKGVTNKADLARALNQSFQTVKNWESRGMSKAGMLKAQAEIGCSATWLETGEGPMTIDLLPAGPLHGLKPGSFMRVESLQPEDPRLTIIPKVRLRLTAGISGYEVEPEPFDGATTTVPTEWMERRGYHRDKLVAITVRGHSMEPTFFEGDLVVINTADTQPVAGAVFAVNYEGEPAIKRLKRDMGRWWLMSDNVNQREYYPVSFESDTSKIIGRIVRKETERF